MPRSKKAIRIRSKNLPWKQISHSNQASNHVSDSEDSDFVPYSSSDNDELSDTEDIDNDLELKTEGDLFKFAAQMQAAHDTMIAEERSKTRKRPRHYKGNSLRSRERWEQKRRELEKKGFQSVGKFFKSVKHGLETGRQAPEIEVREPLLTIALIN